MAGEEVIEVENIRVRKIVDADVTRDQFPISLALSGSMYVSVDLNGLSLMSVCTMRTLEDS